MPVAAAQQLSPEELEAERRMMEAWTAEWNRFAAAIAPVLNGMFEDIRQVVDYLDAHGWLSNTDAYSVNWRHAAVMRSWDRRVHGRTMRPGGVRVLRGVRG